MPSSLFRLLGGAALVFSATAYNTDDQVGADIPYGTFQDPSAQVRPRFRYWIPDASVNLSYVVEDLAQVKAVGAGGVELLGYYLYGNFPSFIAEGGPAPTDWTKDGWGTEAWKALQDTAFQATKDQGLFMDFSLGPNQGAGVPAETGDPGIMWDLWPFNVSVPIGGSFDGTLPGWNNVTGGEFVAASIGLVTNRSSAVFSASPAFIGYKYNGTNQVLSASSLVDVTDLVDTSTGHLSYTFPSDVNGLEFLVFAFYQNQTNYMEQAGPWYVNTAVTQSPVESYRENGSWIVDHFSSTGAQLVIDFWEKYLLSDGSRELIQEVGNYAWEDSQEFGAGTLVWWTPKLLSAFSASRGYSLTKYLPLIYQYNNERPAPLASPDHFYTDEPDAGRSHINDYWQVLTELNQIYLSSLTNWSLQSLQSQFSAQVSYNLPMDMLANIPYVNAPECESLGFNHLIDGYRQYSGPANLAGKRIISSELGAQRVEVYTQTLPELIWDIKRSIVGGVNQFVLHGYPFSGDYPNTTWPGFTTFTYRFSGMHGPRQPAWEYYQDYLDWIARVQFVAQSGVPKFDLAFWLKSDQYISVTNQYFPLDLEQAGFTYEYLSPDNFDLPEAYVANGILAPNRQAFKALIIRHNDTLTVSGVDKLVEWVNEGLPIIISGGLPQNLSGYNVSGTEYVRSQLSSIVDRENVHTVPFENLAESLTDLGFAPLTAVSADRIWYTYWREDTSASVTYVFVYNDAFNAEFGQGASSGSVTFATTGVPYFYDAWKGDVSPVVAYQQSDTSTTIPLSLAGNQSIIIGFHHNEPPRTGTGVVLLPKQVYSAAETEDSITIKAAGASSPVLLSNGSSITLPTPAAPINLTSWTLTIESWDPPADLYASQTQAVLTNSTYNITSLLPWSSLSPSLANTSGRGFYTTTFTWPPADGDADGAVLSLGAIFHTARVWVNGQPLPPLDPTDAWADVGEALVEGTNEVEVVVSSTLGNVLRPIYKEIRSSGTRWLGPQPRTQGYGLLSPVSVVPYRSTTIEL
ncbi:alpha-L-rhamnosidase [Teratosphaeria destructans]|uniref:Alpha-L-rhamnosidase n=1 Tax=Teratosphaeria destructans TaxID=418781 RepID=A0A9W7T1W2_9PEZI|nr:alpha-L-rhamnosidase [Teratosphaeria destructans]